MNPNHKESVNSQRGDLALSLRALVAIFVHMNLRLRLWERAAIDFAVRRQRETVEGNHERGNHVRQQLGLSEISAEQNRRSEEHTSELQSLMRISYAAFCLKKKKQTQCITDLKQ